MTWENTSSCALEFDSSSKESKPVSSTARVAYNMLLLKEASVQDLTKATGHTEEIVVTEMKTIKREVGGVKGSAAKGYRLVKDPESRLKLSDWVSDNL